MNNLGSKLFYFLPFFVGVVGVVLMLIGGVNDCAECTIFRAIEEVNDNVFVQIGVTLTSASIFTLLAQIIIAIWNQVWKK